MHQQTTYLNLPGALSGTLLVTIGVFLIVVGVRYYKTLKEPGKRLALRFLMSVVLFTLGSVGVIVDSLTRARLWFIMAAFYTASYMLLVYSVGVYLRLLRSQQAGPKKLHEKIPRLPISGAYAFRKPASPKELGYLAEISSGLLVISRVKKELWAKKYQVEPDEFIWLSGVEGENAIGPTKLHVLQGTILRFLKERKGKAVVYFEGIEYLILYNDFSSVAKFLFSLKDYVLTEESLLILYIPPGVLDRTQESILLKEFQEIEEKELINKISQNLMVATIEGIEGEAHASAESPEERSGAREKETEKAGPLRREETSKERG